LSNYIENDRDIKGIYIEGKQIKQTFFADDASFINDGTQMSFEPLVYVLKNFSLISGLNLNTRK
jgi:hypothetical protein